MMEAIKTCLIIDAQKSEQLALDQGSLCVRMQQQSALRFPLKRLSRIHIIGELQNGFSALLHCAEQQIPVSFFTVKGKLRCQLYFPVYENSSLSHWLEHIEFDPQAHQEFEQWQQAQTLHLLAQLGYNKGCAEKRMQLAYEHTHHLCKQKLGETHYRLAQDWLEGFLTSHLSQIIVHFGFANQSRGKRKLMETLSPLFNLWLYHQLHQQIHINARKINAQNMNQFYQNQSDNINYTAKRMLSQLATRLETII